MNVAIIVAAGSGKRFGTKTPKQFLEICGKPLIIHTLQRFQFCAEIDEIILVLPSTETAKFLQIVGKHGITKLAKVIAGGQTRAESVSKGLKSIRAATAEIIAVHDGARPLVQPDEISACIKKAQETGAAILASSVTDTIKQVSAAGEIIQTVERARLRRALTPQCFRYEILKRAFENADLNESATDESFLVEKSGVAVSIIEGSADNIKITHKSDLILAEAILKGDKS